MKYILLLLLLCFIALIYKNKVENFDSKKKTNIGLIIPVFTVTSVIILK